MRTCWVQGITSNESKDAAKADNRCITLNETMSLVFCIASSFTSAASRERENSECEFHPAVTVAVVPWSKPLCAAQFAQNHNATTELGTACVLPAWYSLKDCNNLPSAPIRDEKIFAFLSTRLLGWRWPRGKGTPIRFASSFRQLLSTNLQAMTGGHGWWVEIEHRVNKSEVVILLRKRMKEEECLLKMGISFMKALSLSYFCSPSVAGK